MNGSSRVSAARCSRSPGGLRRRRGDRPGHRGRGAAGALFRQHALRGFGSGSPTSGSSCARVRLPAIEDPNGAGHSAVRFSAQEQIAMPLDQAVIDHRVIGGVGAIEGAPPQVDVMVVAARRDMIAASLKPLRDAGLEPVGVDLSAFGMIRALGETVARTLPRTGRGRNPPHGALLQHRRRHQPRCREGRSCLFTGSRRSGSTTWWPSLTGGAPGCARARATWLDTPGSDRAPRPDRRRPGDSRRSARPSSAASLATRRAATLARLLRRPGGGRAGRACRRLRHRQRDRRLHRAAWTRPSDCRSRSGDPERGRMRAPAWPPASPSPTDWHSTSKPCDPST